MAFDLDDAKRLIRQVRERSQGPGTTTLDALAAALDGAVHEVNTLEGVVGGLKSALEGQREHAERSSTLGHELQATAQAALKDAQAQERSALDSLAALLEGATARIMDLEDEGSHVTRALGAARAQADQDREAQKINLNLLTADLRAARAVAAQQAATLARLAALPWWKRVFHAE